MSLRKRLTDCFSILAFRNIFYCRYSGVLYNYGVAQSLVPGAGGYGALLRRWSVCRAVSSAISAPAPGATQCPNPATANPTLEAYAGIWYEIGSTALIKSRTESDLVCITARYSAITSGNLTGAVRVRNEGYNTSSGEFSTIVGSASVVSAGRFGVSFFPGAPPADYRIIYLTGTAAEKYKTAVVYSCDGEAGGSQSLYILSRTPELDDDETVEKLVAFAAAQGIVLEANNQLVLTPQDDITCGRNHDD